MTKVTLFEIPIYSMKIEEFDKKWNKIIKRYNTNSYEKYRIVESSFFPKKIWKYNQIIGYIVINLIKYEWSVDIDFEWYQSENKRNYVNSSKKIFISNNSLNGYHFFVNENDSNNEIKTEIKEWLDELLKDECLKKRYIDLSVFEIQLKYMDIKKIINDLNKRGGTNAKGKK